MPGKDPHPRIHQLRAMGMADSVIFNRLVLEGFDPTVLSPIFAARDSDASHTSATPQILLKSSQTANTALPKKVHRVSLATLAVIALSTVALAASAYMYLKPPVVYSISLSADVASTSAPTLTYGALPALSDPNFHAETKEKLIREKVSFIDADLSAMRLTFYALGEKMLEVPIAAKGKVGSWWETPAGIYQVQTKEKNHFSTFGQVYQPWSLAFQGNFFIHGWPHYEDGTPVSASYSGGCIRLSSEDAEKVYALAATSMPVIVYTTESAGDSFNYQLKAPVVSAAQYLVADVKNGTVLSSKAPSQPTEIASIAKLVTALVATEYINLDKEITVPQSARVYTSVPRLKAGSSVRAYDLLFLLLQESSNEAAEALASTHGRVRFVEYMNAKARAIDMTHTLFSDPSGAKNDLSTPEDLFTLLRYIRENRRFVFDITADSLRDSAYGTPAFTNLNNFNLIKETSAKLVGGKTGQTNEAGETYAGIFSVKIGTTNREIAVVVLGSRDAHGDVHKLLTFVQNLYAPGEPGN